MRGRLAFIAIAIGLLAWQRADAVIKVDTPLKNIERDATHIFIGKVEKFYADKPAMMVNVAVDIKGKAPFRDMPINCKVADPKTFKDNQIEALLKRFGPDLNMVFFVSSKGKGHKAFGYCNGTWFQLQGTQLEPNRVVFALLSAEPYFRKTFNGTTDELVKVLKEHSAGKAKLPELNAKEEPGLGPEYMPKTKTGARPFSRDTQRSAAEDAARAPLRVAAKRLGWMQVNTGGGGGSLFAVIPTIGFAAPLAILAMLFPTVFGGVFVLFRQWLAFITLISVNSTLFMMHFWLAPLWLRGTWWNTPPALWFVMTLAAAACTLWAWRRQLHLLSAGEHDAPPRTELVVLLVMTVSSIATCAVLWFLDQASWKDAGWALTVVMTLGISAGLFYRGWLMLQPARLFAAPPLASEGVILGAMLFGHVAFVPLLMSGNRAGGTTAVNEAALQTSGKIIPGSLKWEFALTDAGFYCSSPLVDGDWVYAAAAHPTFKESTLVCLDRHTGLKKWEFFDEPAREFKQAISTPCIFEGKLYIGEGFHGDPKCKVYCIDAATGTKIWDFKTGNQTESSPTVADGRLFIGAGNDGVYCFDVKKSLEQKQGVVLWHYPPADYKGRDQRFAAGMRVVGDRLYCGTGVHRDPKFKDKGETAVFCFDCQTGKLIWKAASPYPVWSTPVVKDGIVYVGTGNGDITGDAEPPDVPGGALLCLDAESGKERWRFQVDNGLIDSPAVDEGRIYFGSRDGNLYCIGRADGKKRWSYFLESPIIATPVLHVEPENQRTLSVFAIASGGKVCCMNPTNGLIVWTYNLAERQPAITASPRLVVTPTSDGYRRQLYFGAGIGGGLREPTAHRAIFFCLEDHLKVE